MVGANQRILVYRRYIFLRLICTLASHFPLALPVDGDLLMIKWSPQKEPQTMHAVRMVWMKTGGSLGSVCYAKYVNIHIR